MPRYQPPVLLYYDKRRGYLVRVVRKGLTRRQREVLSPWMEFAFVSNVLWKYQPAEIVAGYQRSASVLGVQARDLFSAGLSGLWLRFQLPDGRVIWSLSHREKYSRSLDQVADQPGALLVRGKDWWEGVPSGDAEGKVLASSGGGVEWRPFAGIFWVSLSSRNAVGYFPYADVLPGESGWWLPFGRNNDCWAWHPFPPIFSGEVGLLVLIPLWYRPRTGRVKWSLAIRGRLWDSLQWVDLWSEIVYTEAPADGNGGAGLLAFSASLEVPESVAFIGGYLRRLGASSDDTFYDKVFTGNWFLGVTGGR